MFSWGILFFFIFPFYFNVFLVLIFPQFCLFAFTSYAIWRCLLFTNYDVMDFFFFFVFLFLLLRHLKSQMKKRKRGKEEKENKLKDWFSVLFCKRKMFNATRLLYRIKWFWLKFVLENIMLLSSLFSLCHVLELKHSCEVIHAIVGYIIFIFLLQRLLNNFPFHLIWKKNTKLEKQLMKWKRNILTFSDQMVTFKGSFLQTLNYGRNSKWIFSSWNNIFTFLLAMLT